MLTTNNRVLAKTSPAALASPAGVPSSTCGDPSGNGTTGTAPASRWTLVTSHRLSGRTPSRWDAGGGIAAGVIMARLRGFTSCASTTLQVTIWVSSAGMWESRPGAELMISGTNDRSYGRKSGTSCQKRNNTSVFPSLILISTRTV